MEVRRVDDAAVFLDEGAAVLAADEPRHNLLLGIASTLRDDPSRYPEHRLWLVHDDAGDVVGAALRTPPQNLIVARPRADAAFAALASAVEDDLPGVVGARPEVETFAAAWCAARGVTSRVRMGQGVYVLERVRAAAAVSGRMRAAERADASLLFDWWRAFAVEALHEDAPGDDDVRADVEYRLAAHHAGLVVWDDDGPVSLAGFGGRTPNGIRVGPVYTPPSLRGRGYASALVAELSSRLLADGRRFCFLYTDLANPTSNRIYERIGYERVCASAEIVFEPARSP